MSLALLPARFVEKIKVQGECWAWIGARRKMTAKYGCATVNGRSAMAHRAVYEILIGPIPEGLELDHLCRNQSCVNPDHLEPVSHQVNSQRALIRLVCPKGHPTTQFADRRRCVICKSEYDKQRRATR